MKGDHCLTPNEVPLIRLGQNYLATSENTLYRGLVHYIPSKAPFWMHMAIS